jgi:hypothetical protein
MTDRAADAIGLVVTDFLGAPGVDDWRILDHSAHAWFDAPSLTVGAGLVVRIAELAEGTTLPDVDLRADGVRVRLGAAGAPGPTEADLQQARAISAAARDLGLTADPAVLAVLGLEFETANPASVLGFWQTTLAYEASAADRLRDPLRRDPAIAFHELDQVAALRGRIHLDVVRPPEAVEAIRTTLGREPFGVYGLTLADDEGNEADVVPGDQLGAAGEADDWRVVFSAMACYLTESPGQAGRLAAAAAALAENVGVPLLIDLRPGILTVASGKDLWEDEAQPAGTTFVGFAGRIQSAAHDLGCSADPALARFVQLGIDAVDVPATRAFWADTLGYRPDRRTFLTDIYDPHRLNPEIMFQDLDASDEARRRQRDRIRVVLWVPDDHAQARINTAIAAGGRIVADGTPGRCVLSDPEGTELVLRWG